MRTITLTTGAALTLDGDLLTVLEAREGKEILFQQSFFKREQ